MEREVELGEAFVRLADTLIEGFDPLDSLFALCDSCSTVLDVDAASAVLTGERGVLELSAASGDDARMLALFEVQQREGPCQDAYHAGYVVRSDDLGAESVRWPRFVSRALDAGFGSACALPLRVRDEHLGALCLLRRRGALGERDVRTGQALVDVAAIGLLHERAVRAARGRVRDLEVALDRRPVIEQAKGILAERLHIGTGEAFEVLRRHARSEHRTVVAVAAAVVEGRLRLE